MGLPFDLEWSEMLDRLPLLSALYRRAALNSAMTTAALPAPISVTAKPTLKAIGRQ